MPITFTPWLGKHKMKKMIIGTLMGLILVSFASAGLVGFLSNTVSGEVVVEGPVFYLDATLISGHDLSLIMNNDDVKEGEYTLGNTKNLARFTSDSLGIDGNFYKHDFDIYLILEADGYTGDKTGAVNVSIDILEEDGTPRGINLCQHQIIGIAEKISYDVTCKGKDNLKEMNPTDRIRLSIMDYSAFTINEKIFIKGNSKFQIVGAYNE